MPFDARLQEVVDVVKMGVDEIDIVINRSLVIKEDWRTLFEEISSMKKACGKKCLKTILSTGELPSLEHVHHAAMVAMQAGSDIIKTSTGKETVNATLPVGIVMCQAIKLHEARTGRKVTIIFYLHFNSFCNISKNIKTWELNDLFYFFYSLRLDSRQLVELKQLIKLSNGCYLQI